MVAPAEKLKIDYDPVTGEETVKMFAEFYSTPPALVAQARKYTEPDQN
jgi:hypothetical protein